MSSGARRHRPFPDSAAPGGGGAGWGGRRWLLPVPAGVGECRDNRGKQEPGGPAGSPVIPSAQALSGGKGGAALGSGSKEAALVSGS